MTRGDWYTQKNGGGLRTARRPLACEQALCLRKVQPGEAYFDTAQTTAWPKTKRICVHCSQEELK